jgi:hypothetical protein
VRNLRIKWLAVVTVLLSHIIFIPEASANNCSVTFGTVSGTTRSAQITTGSGCVWAVPAGVTSLSYLLVGGGGGGGGARASANGSLGGGGGGAGGQVVTSTLSVVAGNAITITVGTGGAGGAASTDGGNGSSTAITYLGSTTTVGAGLGGKGSNSTFDQANLSGDGGANNLYSGGASDWDGGGGGAGAGGGGPNGIDIGGQGGTGGAGGIGVSSSILGTARFYGGGGGGGGTPSANSNETDGFGGTGGSGVGGSGGGGAGVTPTAGAANTGSGGGAGGWRNTSTDAQRAGAAGANGIVVFTFTKATAASISSIAITSSAGADRTYSLGAAINLTVTFSEAVTVTGTPLVPIVGLSSRNLSYSSGSGSSALVFVYTVQSTDLNLTGISITANSLTLNSGTFTDTGGLAPTITHSAISTSSNHLVDGIAPTISTSAAISITENSTTVITLAASETATWEILGGTDAAFFTLETSTGVLSISSRDFESPQDGGGNNVYEVSIRAIDLGSNASTSRTFSVTITNLAEVATIGAPTLAATAAKGISVNITISVDVVGKVRFFANGKRITNCLSVATSGTVPSLTATCAWKPSTTGRTSISATLTPTSNQYLGATSATLNTFVNRRTNTRS